MSGVLSTVLVLLALQQQASGVSTKSCPQACNQLRKALPSGAVTTSAGQNAYWAAQIESIQAQCYIQPRTTAQVAQVVAVAQKHQCPFAIRGGGHSDVPGASNLADGLVLNLASFKDVKLSRDKSYATVGAGNAWGDVYSTLDKLNYTVVGGRETSVGVAGLTLGGGISYFSGMYGLACDNVLRYEAVLANGTAVNVTHADMPDLYKALRGGGNNFAVVTRFDLAAYPYHLMQGGLTIWRDSEATTASQAKALVKFANTGQTDSHAALFQSLSYANGAYVWIDGLYYTAPTPPVAAAPVYAPFFTAQLNRSRVASTLRQATQGDLARELAQTQPSGLREQFHTATFLADEALLAQIYAIYRDVVAKTQRELLTRGASVDTLTAALAFQPLPTNILQSQERRGGNVLGLTPDKGPRMLLSMAWPWHNADNDGLFNAAMMEVVDRSVAEAKRRGKFDGYIYMNYAPTGAEVLKSYGERNVRFMRRVAARYDPEGVFQTLVPGGFKLP